MGSKRTVEFDAHKRVKRPTDIEFRTRDGEKIDFVARKSQSVPVHVKFKAKR
jgi:hypothetical protein